MHGRVVERGVLLNGVVVLQFDGYVAMVFAVGHLDAWCAAASVP